MRIAAGEVAARRADIRHEHRVAHEGGVANQVGHVGRRMARHVDGRGGKRADLEGLAIGEQAAEL
ncbi:hypothetical protein D3C71_2143820 [compost metagenome]